MADKSIQLLKNHELYGEMRSNALKRAREFDIENIGPDYLKIYREALDPTP